MGVNDAPDPTASIIIPQNTVVVNGAAIHLITTLVESARADMREMKADLVKQIDDRFDTHEEMHDRQRVEDLDFQKRARERLTDLEKKDIAEDTEEAVKKARRDGQMSLITGIPRIASGIERYGKLIVLALTAGAAALLTALGHISISIGGGH